jgi:hypothetical protein
MMVDPVEPTKLRTASDDLYQLMHRDPRLVRVFKQLTRLQLINHHGDGEPANDDSRSQCDKLFPPHRLTHGKPMIILIHQPVLLIRILVGDDTLIRGLAVFLSESRGEGVKACSTRMSLEGVRQGHEEDDSESTDGDDDRCPGVHGDDVTTDALAERQVADNPEL